MVMKGFLSWLVIKNCEELCLTGEENFSKFWNPGMAKSTPFFQKQRKDHAITRFLDRITHGPVETKWLGDI